jgi:hypothetical protein
MALINLARPKSSLAPTSRWFLDRLETRINVIASLIEQAKNPRTVPEQLTNLAQTKHNRIRAAVADNPNASLETLWTLVESHSEAVLHNPAINLALLEQPDLLTYPLEAVFWLARVSEAGNPFRAMLLKQPNISFSLLALHDPSTSARELNTLYRMALKVQGNRDNPQHPAPELAAAWANEYRQAHSSNIFTLLIARHPNASPKLLHKIFVAALQDQDVLRAVFEHPKAPNDVFIAAMNPWHEQLTEAAWTHPLAPSVLAQWLEHPRSAPDFNATDLVRIARTGQTGALWAARHPNTSNECLGDLARHASVSVRALVAKRDGLSSLTRTRLALESNPRVVVRAIQCADLPHGIYALALERLTLEAVLHAQRQIDLSPIAKARLECYRLALTHGPDWDDQTWKLWLGEVVFPTVGYFAQPEVMS